MKQYVEPIVDLLYLEHPDILTISGDSGSLENDPSGNDPFDD